MVAFYCSSFKGARSRSLPALRGLVKVLKLGFTEMQRLKLDPLYKLKITSWHDHRITEHTNYAEVAVLVLFFLLGLKPCLALSLRASSKSLRYSGVTSPVMYFLLKQDVSNSVI